MQAVGNTVPVWSSSQGPSLPMSAIEVRALRDIAALFPTLKKMGARSTWTVATIQLEWVPKNKLPKRSSYWRIGYHSKKTNKLVLVFKTMNPTCMYLRRPRCVYCLFMNVIMPDLYMYTCKHACNQSSKFRSWITLNPAGEKHISISGAITTKIH